MGTARQASDPSKAEFARSRCLPAELDLRVLARALDGDDGHDPTFRLAPPIGPRGIDGAFFYATLPFRVTRERGKLLSSKMASKVVATVHPSSLLRQPDEESRHREYKKFVADLRVAVKAADAG